MDKEALKNRQKIKDHFETLPEFKRDNMFYKRAVAICDGEKDLIEHPPLEPEKEVAAV